MRELTPSQKGAAAEAAITAAAIRLGLVVLRPLCEGNRARRIQRMHEFEFGTMISRMRSRLFSRHSASG